MKKQKPKLTRKQRRELREKETLQSTVAAQQAAIKNLQLANDTLREASAKYYEAALGKQSEAQYLTEQVHSLEQRLNIAYENAKAVAMGMAIEADELDSRSDRLQMRIKALGFNPAMATDLR
jgi:hypothetical protein